MRPNISKDITRLFQLFNKQKVIVIGDLMLDAYLWGKVSRISPEAPVPVVEVSEESYRFGGAANVTYNINSLGAEVVPIGLIGGDNNGIILKELFEKHGFSSAGLIVDKNRPTTVKTRIIAHNQQVVRTDREDKSAISVNMQQKILGFFKEQLKDADAVILEDYNKGLLTPGLIEEVISLAVKQNVKVLVDPKYDNFFSYKNVTVFKPNRKEASDRLGMRIETENEARTACERLLHQLNCEAVLLTLGEQGMILHERNGKYALIPTKAQEVHDVSGAGDTVIATIAIAMSAGASLMEAAVIANQAAGIVCGVVGIIPVDKDILHNKMLNDI